METRYQAVVAAVEHAISEADPIGLLEGGAPADEYNPEIGTIVSRVVNAQSVEEVTTVSRGVPALVRRRHCPYPPRIRSTSGQDLEGSTRIPKERLTPNSRVMPPSGRARGAAANRRSGSNWRWSGPPMSNLGHVSTFPPF
jgi:hypothetical protein